MKSTGIVRKVDELGRIVIPMELRRTLEIAVRDPLEIFVSEDTIMLRKFQSSCTFCDSISDIISYKGKNVCKKCIAEMKKSI